MHRLEQIVIDTLADLGLRGATQRARSTPASGSTADGPSPRKIAAIGVRTLRPVPAAGARSTASPSTSRSDLAMFGHIVPCGIADRGVTSLRAEGIDVTMDQVVEAFVARARPPSSPTGTWSATTSSTGPAGDGVPGHG